MRFQKNEGKTGIGGTSVWFGNKWWGGISLQSDSPAYAR